ncbi:hypothetical protein [Scatolibacter rhodanostii]|uniref:hypothetical protein n=1 Tax=Scatolibacter rhodanostii TaxID=2014781 RepID=UPI000C073F79|nr:hypothetical protein [Scatolibacter rhodanostii]
MSKNKFVRRVALFCIVSILSIMLVSCGQKAEEVKINTKTSSVEDMVSYLKSKKYIAEDAQPVDINKTAGYLQDNTNGEFTDTAVADAAVDYDGIWIFWWNQDEPTDFIQVYNDMKVNSGVILLGGGAAMLQTEAQNGSFAIAFAEDYANKDAVLKDFQSLAE